MVVTPALASRPVPIGEIDGLAAPTRWASTAGRRRSRRSPRSSTSPASPRSRCRLYFGDDGLPTAVQLIGPPAREEVLLGSRPSSSASCRGPTACRRYRARQWRPSVVRQSPCPGASSQACRGDRMSNEAGDPCGFGPRDRAGSRRRGQARHLRGDVPARAGVGRVSSAFVLLPAAAPPRQINHQSRGPAGASNAGRRRSSQRGLRRSRPAGACARARAGSSRYCVRAAECPQWGRLDRRYRPGHRLHRPTVAAGPRGHQRAGAGGCPDVLEGRGGARRTAGSLTGPEPGDSSGRRRSCSRDARWPPRSSRRTRARPRACRR